MQPDRRQGWRVTEPIIEREEVVALLFTVTDIAVNVEKIRFLLGGDGVEEEDDEG
jgi:hypothetical protein